MATVESITKRLDALEEDRGYFSIEDLVSACSITGELQIEDLCREHPFKAINPAMVRFLSEDRSE